MHCLDCCVLQSSQSICVGQEWQDIHTVCTVVQELHRTYGLGVLHAAREDPACPEGAGCGWGW